MPNQNMQARTRAFALDIIRLVDPLPRGRSADAIGGQLVRSATSIGANYRSACRARSRADFIAKMKIVEEEADESVYWLELLLDSGLVPADLVEGRLREANEIVAIVVASIRTARANERT